MNNIIETYLVGLMALALGIAHTLGVPSPYIALAAALVTVGTVVEYRRDQAARAAFKAELDGPPVVLPNEGGAVTYTINVNGALTPEEIGRQIEEILKRRGGGA